MRRRLAFWLLLTAGCGAQPIRSEPPPAAGKEPAVAAVPSAVVAPPSASAPATPPPKLAFVARDPSAPPAPLPLVEIKFPILAQRVPLAKAATYRVRLKVENWPLGETGDGVELVLDDHPPRRVKSLDQTELSKLVTEGYELSAGHHLLVAAAVRKSGELVRANQAGSRAPWAAVHFFVGDGDAAGAEKVDAPAVVIFQPRGTYNGQPAADAAYLDFIALGVELGPSAAKLGISVEGEGIKAAATRDSGGPVGIQGLPSGDFRVELGLIGADGMPLGSPRARAARTITVNRDAPIRRTP